MGWDEGEGCQGVGWGEGKGCQGRARVRVARADWHARRVRAGGGARWVHGGCTHARLQQRLAGYARGEHGDRDVGGDEATEEQHPHGQPAAEVGAQPAQALGGAALRVPGEG